MSHTPGPWHTEYSEAERWRVFGPGSDEWVADCGYGGNAEACAALTAAAPELLEALDDLLAAIPKQTDDCDWWQDDLTHAVAAAKKAIAKAEGRQ